MMVGLEGHAYALTAYVRHAKKHGTLMVFETAYESRDLTLPELALLVKELRSIQRSIRKGWRNGVPMVHGRQGYIPNPQTSPPGIVGGLSE